MLPRNLNSSKLLFLASIAIIVVSLLVAYCAPHANAMNEVVTIEMLSDGVDNYLITGTIEAERVEVTLRFARSMQIFRFGSTGGTVHFGSVHTQSPPDVFVGAQARAISDGVWRDIDVLLMSSTQSTPEPTETVTQTPTQEPRATLQPWTPQPTATVMATNTPFPAPTRRCVHFAGGCKVYLPLVAGDD